MNLAVERVGADGADEFVEIRGRGDASQLSVGLTRREKKKKQIPRRPKCGLTRDDNPSRIVRE